jgi:SAM-dependent methyltransferase
LYKHRDERDAKKILSLILKTIRIPENATILDLACGNGRHSLLFAKMGFKTSGIDISDFLISEANKLLDKKNNKIKNNLSFEIKDMRKLSHKREFDLVVNLFSSFGYFEKDFENEKVIKSVANALKPNGYFILDFLNSEYVINNLVPFSVTKIKNIVIYQIRTIKNNFVVKEIIIHDKLKKINSRFTEKIRLFNYQDFKRMFNKYGLKIIRKFGDYEGNEYDSKKSHRLIIFSKNKSD